MSILIDLKVKFTLITIILLTISLSSFAQLSQLIDDFRPAYAKSDVSDFVEKAENLLSTLDPHEKLRGERILTLFKVLTGNSQDMSTKDFNKAMNEVGLSSVLVKNINADLALISIKSGGYRSYLIFNQGKNAYRFRLRGIFKTTTKSATQNFDGGVNNNHCRIISYTATSYTYTVTSVSEIPSIF